MVAFLRARARALVVLAISFFVAVVAPAAVAGTLSIGDVTVTEGNSGTKLATFTISLSAVQGGPVNFDVATADGSASAGSDYIAKSQTGMRIPAGVTSKTFAVTINGDTNQEVDETFFVNLSNASGASIADGVGIGTISNDDSAPMPSLSVADASIAEGDSGSPTLVFTVSLSAAASSPVTFDVSTSDFSANAGVDYVAVALQGQSIPPGETSKTISVTIDGDTDIEADESFALNISNVTGASVTDGSAVGRILNDDQAEQLPSLSLWASSATEGNVGEGPNMQFVVTMSSMAVHDVTFHYATTDGAALAGEDYVSTSGTATISAGQTSVWINVPIIGGATPEPDEDFTLTISDPVNAQIVQAVATGGIEDDDTPPLPTLSISNQVITPEGNSGTSQAVFTLQLSAPASTDVTYDIATIGNTATSPSDFVAKSLVGQVIPAGQTSKTFSVTINGDTAVENDEVYIVQVNNVTGATMPNNQGIGKIRNDDGVPALSIGDVTVTEGDSGTKIANFTLSLSQASSTVVQVDIHTADGTAVAGSDYSSGGSLGFNIPAGQTSAQFGVEILGDTAFEADETFAVNLSNPVNATIADGQAVGTITNDDAASGPTLSINDVSVTEGNASTKTATFTITLSAAQSGPVLVDVATANGTATAGSDYVAKTTAGLRIPAGTTSKNFVVTINGDTTSEPDETFTVNLSNASAGVTIGDGVGLGTITNDDAVATPTLSIADASVSEGNSGTKTLAFTVSLSPAASGTVSYDIATSNGTATAGSDYVASTLTGQQITAGQTSKTFAVTINGDTSTEANETFNVTLSNVSGAIVGDGAAVGTISNDDGGSGPTLSIGDVSIAEGNALTKQMTFTVSLSAAASTAVTYNIATANGTAVAPTDYTAKSLTGQSIPAGTTSKTFVVVIKGDKTVEPNETFLVNVTNVAGATIADGQATGTITNDDAAALSIARFDARGIVDDVDDGNRQPQIAPGEYATLLADSATTMCRRAPDATVIAVEGIEHKQVLADLADAANTLCAGKPQYTAVTADKDSRGFLIATPAKGELGTTVLAAPEANAKSTTLSILGAGHATPVSIVLASEPSKALLLQLQQARKAQPDQALVLLGTNAANGLLDLTAREFGQAKAPLPAERVLVNPVLVRNHAPGIELVPLPADEAPAQVLHLQ